MSPGVRAIIAPDYALAAGLVREWVRNMGSPSTDHSRPGAHGRRAYRAAWLAVAAALCAPIWLPSLPPLSDFYNHLARLYILAHHADVPAYQAFYAVDWGPMPNLALELVGLPLLRVLDLETTGKLFLSLTVLLWHAGCSLLGRAVHGRPVWRALVCSFFVYNQQLLHGYCNFAFGMGLCLVVLALWIRWRARLGAWHTLALAILSSLVFLCHLSAFATLGIAVATITVLDALARRRDAGPWITGPAILGVLPLIPGTVTFFLGFLRATGGNDPIVYAPITYNLRDAVTVLVGYSPAVDAASLVVAALLAGALLLARADLVWKRDLLAPAIALAVAYWVCPADVASGLEVNVRFALGATTLLVLAADISVPPRVRRAVLAVALAGMAARTGVTAAAWLELDREFRQHLAAFEHIEEGAAVHNIYFYPAPRLFNATRVRGLALIHTLGFAAVHRRANVPTLYALPGQQPLVHRTPMYRAHRFHDRARPRIQWPRIFGHYQYVWVCRAPADLIAPLRARGRVVAEAGACALYALSAPSAPGQSRRDAAKERGHGERA